MEYIRSKEFFLICAILIAILVIYRVFSFYAYKRKLKVKSIELIKLENYKRFSYLFLFAAFCMLVPLYLTFFWNGYNEIMLPTRICWILLFFVQLTAVFINPQNYIIIAPKGFRKSYLGRLVLWDKIESIAVIHNEIFITVNKKVSAYTIGDRSDLNHLLVRIKSFRPDLYDNFLMNLNITG